MTFVINIFSIPRSSGDILSRIIKMVYSMYIAAETAAIFVGKSK
jgi:hypothetical protein